MTARLDAPAKINLVLRVLDPDASGYHDLRTLFCALALSDSLEVSLRPAAAGVRVVVNGPDVGPEERNLAYRAARAFLHEAGRPDGVRIRLDKRIPAGGGLGGGSSDAAATLRALASLLPDSLDDDRIRAIGAGLGSDVPFFLQPSSLAWGEGRGDVLSPIPPLPSRSTLVVIPPFGIATGDAYRWLDDDRRSGKAPSPADREPALDPATANVRDWADIAAIAANDFEAPVFRRHPALVPIRDDLRGHGAAPALLAGSGSSLFGIFEHEADAAAAADAIARDHPACRIVATGTLAR